MQMLPRSPAAAGPETARHAWRGARSATRASICRVLELEDAVTAKALPGPLSLSAMLARHGPA